MRSHQSNTHRALLGLHGRAWGTFPDLSKPIHFGFNKLFLVRGTVSYILITCFLNFHFEKRLVARDMTIFQCPIAFHIPNIGWFHLLCIYIYAKRYIYMYRYDGRWLVDGWLMDGGWMGDGWWIDGVWMVDWCLIDGGWWMVDSERWRVDGGWRFFVFLFVYFPFPFINNRKSTNSQKVHPPEVVYTDSDFS